MTRQRASHVDPPAAPPRSAECAGQRWWVKLPSGRWMAVSLMAYFGRRGGVVLAEQADGVLVSSYSAPWWRVSCKDPNIQGIRDVEGAVEWSPVPPSAGGLE